jgi:glycerol uptake facilitator-like aquaporin
LTLIILTGNDPAKLGLGAVVGQCECRARVGFAAEVIGTAILVFTVFGAAVSGKAPPGSPADHRLHRLRDHHPRRPDHRRLAQPGPRARPALLGQAIGATPVPVDQLIVVYIFGSTIGAVVGAFLYEFIGREVRPRAGPRRPPTRRRRA